MLKKFSIKGRLIFVLATLSIEIVIGAVLGLLSLAQANREFQSLYVDSVITLTQLDQVVRKLNLTKSAIYEAILDETSDTPALIREIEQNQAILSSQWQAYLATNMDDEERSKANQFETALSKFDKEAQQPAIQALQHGKKDEAAKIVFSKFKPLFSPVRKTIDELIQIQLQEARISRDKSQSTYEFVRTICLAGLFLGLFLSAVIGTTLVKSIVKPLRKAIDIAHAVANGDLTHTISVESNDETGRLMYALKNMNQGLIGIVTQVRTGTDAITTASGQIAAGNQDLAARTEQQAAALEETAASMNELTSIVKENARNARKANLLAVSASDVAIQGGRVMNEIVTTMEGIKNSAFRMSEILTVIDGLAYQSHLLSINASVEAARAGEHGRGFSAVSLEVRHLAQRSAEAAKEVKALLGESAQKVECGAELVASARTTMDDIVRSIFCVADVMAEITSASQDQSAGIEQASRAIADMDQTTQQNAALVEEASAAARLLHEEAEQLNQEVSTFHLPKRANYSKLAQDKWPPLGYSFT